MTPKFGTSGLRGLVTELTPELVAGYVRAFLAACPTGGAVHVGWDLRPSSPGIAETVIDTLTRAGTPAVAAGAVPTPALALAAMAEGHGAIMVTGSHIPADRNGLKFYTPRGEIAKADEAAILAVLDRPAPPADAPAEALAGSRREDAGVADRWAGRGTRAFGPAALAGLRLGVYEHSSVARDPLARALAAMGAEVIRLGRSDVFVPVDTEAVEPATRKRLAAWCAGNRLDALVSTDGDADRPMVVDASGTLVPGDVLGPLTARALGADTIVTPVSSNTLVDGLGFARIERTRIGSPYVIAGMEAALAADPAARVAGYEANGGFLLGFEAAGPEGPLPPLMTRDSLLPIVAPLAAARAAGRRLAELAAALPARFTAADRLQGIDPEASRAILERLEDPGRRAAFFAGEAPEAGIDRTDGLRLRFKDDRIAHLRPSGNAPEFRVYAEAESRGAAEALLARVLDRLRDQAGD